MDKASFTPALKLLTVIVDEARAENVTELFRAAKVHLHYHLRAHGTASSEILDLLGLGVSEKTVILAVETRRTVYELQKQVSHELRLLAPGRGIAFILPLSGISKVALRFLEQELLRQLETSEGDEMSEQSEAGRRFSHDLILAVIKRGYSEDLMEAARAAGAGGGTVIPAHRVAAAAPLRYWGASLQEEKDLVAIISKREDKAKIMLAINEKCGLKSEAQGWVFSLPVESVAGLADVEA